MTSVSLDHLQKLGNFAATLSLKDVPDNARRVMKNVILDALACAFAAARLDPSCGIISSVSTSSFGGGACTNLFDGSATSVCPSSDNLRHFGQFSKGGSGSSGLEFKRLAADAASVWS
jgi:hypothetical protein